jgi:predicted DNA-binding protein (UPF0251 family)
MNRWIRHQPVAQFYTPQGVPLGRLRGVTLTLDGLEALRLADAEGLEQEAAAELMGVSRPTFSRVLAEARRIVAKGLVNGWAIRIEGGNYEFAGDAPPCGRGRRRCRKSGGGRWAPAPHEPAISSGEPGTPNESKPFPGREPGAEAPAQPAAEYSETSKPQ